MAPSSRGFTDTSSCSVMSNDGHYIKKEEGFSRMLFLLCTRKFVDTNEDCIQLRIPNLYIWRCLVQAVALITVHTVR